MVNRAFIYGDLLFETIRVKDGVPLLVHAHYQRLATSATILKMDISISFADFTSEIKHSIAKSNLKDARVRFVLHRNGEGFYSPHTSGTSYFVEVFPLPDTQQLLHLGLYTDNYKSCNELSTLKSGNALLYVMAGLWAKEQGYDDVLLLNEHGCVCEATSSNVFVVKDEKVITPPISEGCVAGVMRQFILNRLQEQHYDIKESVVTIEHIQQADAVFLSNAISGIRRVHSFESITYKTDAGGIFSVV
jgi:branched-chain amino acid aminotransferase